MLGIAAVSFLVLGQSGPVKIAFIGDQGLGSSSEAVYQLCLDEGAHAVVVLGDFDYNDSPSDWLAQMNSVLGPSFPHFAVVGNHDTSEFAGYRQASEQRLQAAGVQWQGTACDQHSFTFQGVFFVFSSPGLMGGGDASYVASRLASAESQAASWRVSGWHVLMEAMQVGGKGDESGWEVYENSRVGGAIIATAHEHSYERTNLLADMSSQQVAGVDLTISEGETFAFVSGLGGESVRDQERCFPTSFPYGCNGTWASVYTSQQGAEYGALFIEFRHEGEPCLAHGYFKDINGEVVDDFFIASNVGPCAGGPPPPPPPCCEWDLANGDCVINASDFLSLLQQWGTYNITEFLALLLAWGPCDADPPPPVGSGIWISPEEVLELPMSGAGWSRLQSIAQESAGTPNVSDQHEDVDVRTMAKALYAVRTNNESMKNEVRSLVMSAIGTEDGVVETLALGKNLVGYVVAADLVGLGQAERSQFSAWLNEVRSLDVSGRTLVSTHNDRPNNWGTLCGAARMAIALYLEDAADFDQAANVFLGWIDGTWPHEYGDLCWQEDQGNPNGINGLGAVIAGVSVDGVLPDDQRRSLLCPPDVTCENYAWTAMQGVVAQAVILGRHGHPEAWTHESSAVRRAVQWLYAEASCPAVSDDSWIPFVLNDVYGTAFSSNPGSTLGKNMDFTDWTHGAN